MNEQQKITDKDILIADFMELRIDNFPDQSCWWFVDLKNLQSIYHNKEESLFESDWNWLMPVIKKCWKIEAPTSAGWSKADRIQYRINDNDIWGDNIKGVYEEVVGFIKWYNEQKSK